MNPDITLPKDPKIKIYTALLTQTGTNPPVAIELQNTLGTINKTRSDIGRYSITSAGLFTENKTIIPPFSGQEGDAYTYMPISGVGTEAEGFYRFSWQDASTIIIEVNDLLGPVEWSSILGDTTIPIEIKVYNI